MYTLDKLCWPIKKLDLDTPWPFTSWYSVCSTYYHSSLYVSQGSFSFNSIIMYREIIGV